MKFKDSYNNQLDNIKPDGYIKDKTRRRMEEAEERVTPKRNGRAFFGTAVAAVLCGAILFSAGIAAGRRTVKVNTSGNTNAMKTVTSYGDIYDIIKKFKSKEYVVYEYAEGDATNDGMAAGTSSANTKGNSASNINEASSEHSDTTVQVEGVDEADIVKTDGKYIYILNRGYKGKTVKIIDVTGEKPKQLKSLVTEGIYATDMYLSGDRLILLGTSESRFSVLGVIYDISDPNNPKEITRLNQSGDYNESRLIDGRLYVISNFEVNTAEIKKSQEETFVPSVTCGDYDGAVTADSVYFYDNCNYPRYTVLCGYDIKDGSLCGTQSVLGGSYTVYASTQNIITCSNPNSEGLTQVARFAIDGGKIDFKATGSISGSLLNQFSIDEYKGYFRFVLTEYKTIETPYETSGTEVTAYVVETNLTNSLVILDGDLKETGKITDLAPGERVYSVRFMGETAYFVTFRQVDPLFSADVSDPYNPQIIGSLKIPGFSSYLFPYGDKLLGIGRNADEQTGRAGLMKLSMFDISDPANVTEGSKTDIPAKYSEALYDHRATLADYGKNIIGFSAYGNTGLDYFVYSYEGGEFVLRLKADFDITGNQECRGLYIGKVFYIATFYELQYYDLETFEPLGTLKLSD